MKKRILTVLCSMAIMLCGCGMPSLQSQNMKTDEAAMQIPQDLEEDVSKSTQNTEEENSKTVTQKEDDSSEKEPKISPDAGNLPHTESTVDKQEDRLSGNGKYRGLEFTATVVSVDTIHINIENKSSDGFSLGWVDGPTITYGTSEGEGYCVTNTAMILAGQSYEFNCYFEDVTGNPEYIKISNVIMLNQRGLPMQANSSGETIEISFGERTNSDKSDAATESLSQNDSQAQEETYSGETNYEGLSIAAKGDKNCIRVTYKNDTSGGYSLGWVQGATIVCTTTAGEYYTTSQTARILAGQGFEENYYFDDAEGTLVSIEIVGINVLSQSGLPVDFSGGGSAVVTF